MGEARKQEVEMEKSEKQEIRLQSTDIQSKHTCTAHSSPFTTSTLSIELSFAIHTIPHQKRRLTSRAARNRGMSPRKRHFIKQTVDIVDAEYMELRMLLDLVGRDGPFAGRLANQQVEEGHRRLLASIRRLKRLVEGDTGTQSREPRNCLLAENNQM